MASAMGAAGPHDADGGEAVVLVMTRIDDIKARLDAREKTTSRYWIGKRRAALFAFDDIAYLLRLVEELEEELIDALEVGGCIDDEIGETLAAVDAAARKRAEDNP